MSHRTRCRQPRSKGPSNGRRSERPIHRNKGRRSNAEFRAELCCPRKVRSVLVENRHAAPMSHLLAPEIAAPAAHPMSRPMSQPMSRPLLRPLQADARRVCGPLPWSWLRPLFSLRRGSVRLGRILLNGTSAAIRRVRAAIVNSARRRQAAAQVERTPLWVEPPRRLSTDCDRSSTSLLRRWSVPRRAACCAGEPSRAVFKYINTYLARFDTSTLARGGNYAE